MQNKFLDHLKEDMRRIIEIRTQKYSEKSEKYREIYHLYNF